MRKLLLTTILFAGLFHVHGQTVHIDFSYDYLYNKQWDKLIRTYNESRPFLDNKQPLFQHGIHAATGYYFPSSSSHNHGISAGYGYFNSAAENEGLNNTLRLHAVTICYQLRLDSLLANQRFYAEGKIGVTGIGAYRRINYEPFIYDEERSKAWGIGGMAALGIGYHFPFRTRMSIDPFVSVQCLPGFYFPGIERVVNQTQGLIATDFSTALTARAGIRLHLRRN